MKKLWQNHVNQTDQTIHHELLKQFNNFAAVNYDQWDSIGCLNLKSQ